MKPQISQKARVLDLLKTNFIVSNVELEEISDYYSVILSKLRNEGYIIDSKHLGGQLWKFTYRGRPSDEQGER